MNYKLYSHYQSYQKLQIKKVYTYFIISWRLCFNKLTEFPVFVIGWPTGNRANHWVELDTGSSDVIASIPFRWEWENTQRRCPSNVLALVTIVRHLFVIDDFKNSKM